MQIYENFTSKDSLTSITIVKNLVGLDIDTTPSLTSIDTIIDDQITTQPTELINIEALGSTSAYYNSLKWYFYERSGTDMLPIISGTASTTSISASYAKIITIPRETAKARLVPNSLSATLYITTVGDSSSGTYYVKDEPVTSTSGSNLFYGRLKVGLASNFATTASLTSVGEIFYNHSAVVFRGSDVGKASLSSFINSTTAVFVNGSGTGLGRINITSFAFRREEQKIKKIFFVRAWNGSYNYSNNPSYRNTDGTIKDFILAIGNTTYISTVGIFNDQNDLLAVGNINPVEKKTFETESIFKIAIVY